MLKPLKNEKQLQTKEITLQKTSAVNELADAVNLISPVQADLELAEAHSLARLGYFEGLRESFFAWRNAAEIPNPNGKILQFNNIVTNTGGSFSSSGREFSAPYTFVALLILSSIFILEANIFSR